MLFKLPRKVTTIDNCRTPLPGATIFYINPLSQLFLVSFLFLEAPSSKGGMGGEGGVGALAGVFTIANHKRPTAGH